MPDSVPALIHRSDNTPVTDGSTGASYLIRVGLPPSYGRTRDSPFPVVTVVDSHFLLGVGATFGMVELLGRDFTSWSTGEWITAAVVLLVVGPVLVWRIDLRREVALVVDEGAEPRGR